MSNRHTLWSTKGESMRATRLAIMVIRRCATAAAVFAVAAAMLTACNHSTDHKSAPSTEILRPDPAAGSLTPERTPSAQATGGCDPGAISRDMGQQLNVQRCHGDWAYVNAGELGDAQSLLRRVNGSWTRYAGFPTTICRSAAGADGVPDGELSSFPPC
jgi:hypothetical protein